MLSTVEQRVAALEGQVQTFRNIAWVLGALAAIFGVSGAWGLNVLSSARGELSILQRQVGELGDFLKQRKEAEEAFRTAVQGVINDAKAEMHTQRDSVIREIAGSTQSAKQSVQTIQLQPTQINDAVMDILRREGVVTYLRATDRLLKTRPSDRVNYLQVGDKHVYWHVMTRDLQ